MISYASASDGEQELDNGQLWEHAGFHVGCVKPKVMPWWGRRHRAFAWTGHRWGLQINELTLNKQVNTQFNTASVVCVYGSAL